MSWLKGWEAGAEGKLRLATLQKVLFNFASSGDQLHTVVEVDFFLSVCMSYHFDDLGGLTNWSGSSPPVSVFLEGYREQSGSLSQIFDTATHPPEV